MGMSDGYKTKNSGFVKIGNFGFLGIWVLLKFRKVHKCFRLRHTALGCSSFMEYSTISIEYF